MFDYNVKNWFNLEVNFTTNEIKLWQDTQCYVIYKTPFGLIKLGNDRLNKDIRFALVKSPQWSR